MNKVILEKILAYIDEHIYEKISLNELVQIAGYSPFYFSRLFSEHMGMPVTSYIRIRKMQYAIVSLLEGKGVLDVAMMYAFESHEGFTRSFTQLFGQPPSIIKRFLESYEVPQYVVPNIDDRRTTMDMVKQKNLEENMYQLIYEVLKASLEEVRQGYATKIAVEVLPENKVRITDDGRGIPLSEDIYASTKVLNKILAGYPVTNLEYSQMGDFSQMSLQTVNSLCESLTVKVYRNGMKYVQDYVRGVAQHKLLMEECVHKSGMEMILKPDGEIFGQLVLQEDIITEWLNKKMKE